MHVPLLLAFVLFITFHLVKIALRNPGFQIVNVEGNGFEQYQGKWKGIKFRDDGTCR